MGVNTKGSNKVLMDKAKYLSEKGDEYVIKVINGNYELISDLFKHRTFSKSDYKPRDLNFIKSIKSHILKSEIHLSKPFEKQYFANDVHYIRVAKVPLGLVFENAYEIDLDEAYWKTAHLLGIITDELYVRGQKGNISKQVRLTALGSLAKKVYYYQFKGKSLRNIKSESEPLLENIWFTICKRVADVMNECIKVLGEEFIFYWVDGIYVQGKDENLHTCLKIFSDYGYNIKYKKIKQIYFHDKGFTCNDYGTVIREFNYPHYTEEQEKNFTYGESIKLKNLAQKILNQNFDIVEETEKDE